MGPPPTEQEQADIEANYYRKEAERERPILLCEFDHPQHWSFSAPLIHFISLIAGPPLAIVFAATFADATAAGEACCPAFTTVLLKSATDWPSLCTLVGVAE